jgi:hypothetical protein
MECSVDVQREMLDEPVDVQVDEGAGFEEAKARAVALARERMGDPMLVSWYDRPRGRSSPEVACSPRDEPSWLVYAKSRGAGLTVSVNRETWVFLFADFDG